ncbi:MAG: PaaI family thioesterase [Chloroflexi bacterium]|nr:PaaI family thioesterase [Chloroflexota bacterium]
MTTSLASLGVDFGHWCFGCGTENPHGLHMDMQAAPGRSEVRFTPERRHQGYDGTVHGGVVTALLDETMGWAIFQSGVWAVTARLGLKFRKPVPVGEPLVVSGEIVRDRGRMIETAGAIKREGGEVLAEATATFLRMPEDRRGELERRYRIPPGMFDRIQAALGQKEGT